MLKKDVVLTNFSRATSSQCQAFRPDTERQLQALEPHCLAKGGGLSYNDSFFNTNHTVIDTKRLNHLLHFDSASGILECQGGVRFADLFLVHPDFIPAIIPGTLHATLAGGIAHDVHGKNNHKQGSLGHHIEWIDLVINDSILRCDPLNHSALFHATIAGLGLTGIISRLGIRLQKAPRCVEVSVQTFKTLEDLTTTMTNTLDTCDFQVAWLDLLNKNPQSLLSQAQFTHTLAPFHPNTYKIPKLPCSFIKPWGMKLFNYLYFHKQTHTKVVHLQDFNNPLDKITHWNRLYGPKGLIQFQGVFSEEAANQTLGYLLEVIRTTKATPTLAVLKLFRKNGAGLLSFCKPGFTLAIDFINNAQAQQAISLMNQYLMTIDGRVYLAKDLFLNSEQFASMNPNFAEFKRVIKDYHCNTRSDLGRRLGIVP